LAELISRSPTTRADYELHQAGPVLVHPVRPSVTKLQRVAVRRVDQILTERCGTTVLEVFKVSVR
jgi:hypothetical protein